MKRKSKTPMQTLQARVRRLERTSLEHDRLFAQHANAIATAMPAMNAVVQSFTCRGYSKNGHACILPKRHSGAHRGSDYEVGT